MIEQSTISTKTLKGIAVSPGIVIGKAHVVDKEKARILYQYIIQEDQLNREVERFIDALKATEEQLIRLKERMPEQVNHHAAILESHLMILKDTMLTDATLNRIKEEKMNAEWALKISLDQIRQVFSEIEDEYISTRINDVENVTERILRNLSKKGRQRLDQINGRVIIVARDLSPADTAELDINRVMGFITDVGGRTSHTAIIAQALEIPAVVGMESATGQVAEGDLLIVDGTVGQVIVHPDENAIIHYEEKQLRYEEYKSTIARMSHLPAITLEGHRISVRANIEFLEEVRAVRDYGGEGVGLYRTEFLYLRGRELPTEEELFEDYREVAELIAPEPVTIRTLDLGGDKFASQLEIEKEINPALGLRGIRLCLRELEIFKCQLRAILRAGAYGNVQLMFPMISGLQEVLDVRKILNEVREELDRSKIEYDQHMKVGIMIEVPSAVTMAEVLAEHVDFFSIGTNDLIQYALAIDRGNEHVAYMYMPFHPAILRMIRHVVNAAKNAGISLSLCGEMAGDPLCVSILLGLGIDVLSMKARSIPIIKKIIRTLSIEEARADLERIIGMYAAEEVRAYILDRMKSLFPELEERGYLGA